jgi:hypothetical protein
VPHVLAFGEPHTIGFFLAFAVAPWQQFLKAQPARFDSSHGFGDDFFFFCCPKQPGFGFRISNVSQRILHPITQEVCG